MATYKANSTNTTIIYGNTYTAGFPNDTYSVQRGYLRFNTSTITPTLAQITSVKLYLLYYQCAFRDCSTTLKSSTSTDANWGVALSADVNDFTSTHANTESTVTIPMGASAWYSFTVNKNNLDLAGTTWFRVEDANSWGTLNTAAGFYSQNHATAGNRPYLEITYSTFSGEVIQIINS